MEEINEGKTTASNSDYSLTGEGADGSIIKPTDKVIETISEVNNYFYKRSHFTNYERTMDHKKEMLVQTNVVK